MKWLRHPVFTRFSLLCLVGIATLALAMGYALTWLLTRHVSDLEWQNTAAVVRREVEREGLQAIFLEPGPSANRERWGRTLDATLTTLPEVVRAKVWSRDAEILWSDQPSLIGQRAPKNAELEHALAGHVEVEIKRLDKSEQRFERRAYSTLAEVYVPIFDRDNRVLGVVEVEKTPDRLVRTIQLGHLVIWSISLFGGALLYLVLVPLFAQVYRRQVEEETLRRHATQLEAEVEHRTQQFLQAQKVQAVGLLAGGIAHDFNNVLTVIYGRAQVLLARLPGDARAARQDATAIVEAAERAAGLTRQLLAFSRQQVLERQPLDIHTAIVDMTKMLRRLIGENIAMVTTQGRTAAWVNADRAQLEQVILNLAVNARDAMPGGGQLTVSTDTVWSDGLGGPLPATLPKGRFVELVVSDTGIGMDAATQARIFEPFYTTKPAGAGTGLGLSTVASVVEQHEGHIAVDSTPSKGTTFRIYLAEVGAPATEAPTAVGVSRTGGSETILVAEDDPAVRMLACDMLREHGYTVLTAGDGEEARRVAEMHTGPIHLLLTDVKMPRMDGPQLAQAVTAMRPETAVLFMTGYSEVPPVAGAAVVPKPFSMLALSEAVRHALESTAQSSCAVSPS